MAGRKPKPTAVKKLEGNPGKRKQFRRRYLRNGKRYVETESLGGDL